MSENGVERFGEILTQARQERGLEREELAARTRIQERYLEALETENWPAVPSGLTGRGFVRAVARELGQDPEALLAAYREARGEEDGEPERVLPEADWKVDLRGDRSRSPLVLGLLFLAGALLGIWIWSPWNVAERTTADRAAPTEAAPADAAAKPEVPPAAEAPAAEVASAADEAAAPEAESEPASVPEAEPEPASVPEEAAEPAPPEPASEVAAEPTAEPEGHTLEIQAVEKTWVRVVADEGAPEDRVLDPGERHAYEARDRVAVRLGNAGGVRLFWDGAALKVPGAPGAVMNLAFPRDLERLLP